MPSIRRLDDLLAEAETRTRLASRTSESYLEPLDLLLSSARDESQLNALGCAVLEQYVVERLASRFRVEHWAECHPELSDDNIIAPVFIIGMSRTGTTLLHRLLEVVPSLRVLMRWEALDVTPPPTTEWRSDPRVVACITRTEAMYAGIPELRSQHYEPGDGPTECGLLLGQDFRCIDAEGLASLPSYGKWLQSADMFPAYEVHKKILLILQTALRGTWLLKSPQHMLFLKTLMKTYHDARLLFVHRDPAESVASTARLVHTASRLLSNEDEAISIGRRWLTILSLGARRMAEFDLSGTSTRKLDIYYADLVAKPLDTCRTILTFLGLDMDAITNRRIRARIRSETTGHRLGSASLEDYGLSPEIVREEFAEYIEHFALDTSNS
jgi:hypothetical protein